MFHIEYPDPILAQDMTSKKGVLLRISAVGLCVLGCVLLNLTSVGTFSFVSRHVGVV